MENEKVSTSLGFSEALNTACSRLFVIKGRSRRSEYWWVMAVLYAANVLLTPAIGMIGNILVIPLTIRRLHDAGHSGWWYIASLLVTIVYTIWLIVDMSIAWCSDYDSDPYLAMSLAKYIIGGIVCSALYLVVVIFTLQDSQPFTNKYGESPKAVAVEE